MRSNMVILCGPWGYGRSELLRDYARIAHIRIPSRPIVTIDFDVFEIQAYLAGNDAPLSRLLNRKTRRRKYAAGNDDASDREGTAPQGSDDNVIKTHRVPGRRTNAVTHILKAYMAAYAAEWWGRYAKDQISQNVDFNAFPLVTIDNLPRLDHKTQLEAAELFKAWAAHGARILIATTPMCCIPRNVLPEAYVVTSTMLSISKDELPLWTEELHCPKGSDIYTVTQGIPLLVNALRAVHPNTLPNFDAAYLRASGRVVEHCLDELIETPLERACCAMTMLGHGTLSDLSDVGISLHDTELAILTRTYPLFGIDILKGTFSSIPISCDADSNALVLAVGIDRSLAERCICCLIRQQRLMRTGEITALLPKAVRMRLLAHYPDEFANAANGGIIIRAVKSFCIGKDIDPSLTEGLASLAYIHALAHDESQRNLPAEVQRLITALPENIVSVLHSVFDFWRDQTPYREAAEPTGGAGSDKTSDSHASDDVIFAVGSAALKGDAKAYLQYMHRLEASIARCSGSLAKALYIAHAAVCGILCDQVEYVIAWLEPYCRTAQDPDAAPDSIVSVAQALLQSVYAVACFLVERPSASRITGETLDTLKRSRRFFEERAIRPGVAFIQFLEAVCLILSGNERRAEPLLQACQARWGSQGILLGQCVTEMGLALVELSHDSVIQASVHAKTAVSLAKRMRFSIADELAHLILSITLVRNGDVAETNRQLLEMTLHRSALYPHSSPLIDLNVAVLSAATEDITTTQEILHDPQWFGHPGYCRLLVSILRALGRERNKIIDTVPHRIRSEYESIRPSSAYRRYVGIEEASSDYDRGLISITSADKNLSLHILGGLRVEINGHAISDREWRRHLSRIVLSILALFPENPIPRDTIIEALWDSKTQTVQKRNNLNTVLSSLRASLRQKEGGPYYVISSGDTLYLNLELIDSDVLRFENMAHMVISHARLSDHFDLLDMCSTVERIFGTGLGDEFNDLSRTIDQRREELTDLFINCMLTGSHVACEHADYQLAIWFARAAMRPDPGSHEANVALDEALTAYERQRAKGMASPPNTTIVPIQ